MKYYSSDDVGAPQVPAISGAGAFISVLKAALVNGYGTKVPAGWTNPFNTGTTVAVLKQGAGGNGRYFRIWDGLAAADGYGLRHFRIRGYEAMTASSIGTGAFPNTAQISSNGSYCPYKFDTTYDPGTGTGNVAPKWKIWADALTVVIAINLDGNPTTPWVWMTFGAFDSFKTADAYSDMVAAGAAEYYVPFSGEYNQFGSLFVARDSTAAGGSVWAALQAIGAPAYGGTTMGRNSYTYPDPVTDSLLLVKTTILTSTVADGTAPKIRGSLKWVWDTPHNVPANFPPTTTFSGSGATAGKTFEAVGGYAGSGCAIVETSDTWS